MTKTSRHRVMFWAAVGALGAAASVYAKPLPSDERVVTGKLENGVTWKYRKHELPPGKMALMMHVRTGSLNETDAQRGLAHFLEHMCFNGSEHFPPGELIPYFESIGMEFGADLNAFTSFDQTAYMLFTPDTEGEQIDKALTVLSDYAFRISLSAEEIEKERGVVLEESRSGKSAFQRLRDEVWPELFKGSHFAERLPIGKDEIIANAPREEFVDYYRTWYRPENVTLVMVGDADPEPYLPLIQKWFGQYKPEKPAREPKGPEFKPFTQERAIVATDAEMEICEVELLNITPGRPPAVTVEQARQQLVEYIGSWIVDRRFDDRVKEGKASYRRAGVSVSDFFHDALLINGTARGEHEDWAKMLEELVIEVNRAREFGFTEREFALAKKEIVSEAERAVRTEPTLPARRLVRQIVRSVNDQEPMHSAQQELELYNELLPSINLGEVNSTFAGHFAPGKFAYVVQMTERENVAVPSRDDVLATARAAWARKVEPIEEHDAPTELLAELPQPGKVAESTTDEDLGITSAWLDNGVRVHHRYMDYKKDSVWVSIGLAGGEIEETANNAGVSEVATIAINDAATGRLSSSDMRDIMTGKNIRVGGGSAGDSLSIRITGSPEDLEVGLQKAHALLTDAKLEDAAFNNWKLSTLQRIEMFNRMPRFKAFEAMADLLSGGDPRRTMMTKEKVERQSVAAGQAWLSRLCKSAPIEVAVVGDITLDKAMPLIQKYVGSLPSRPRTAEDLDKLRRLARPTGPLAKQVEVDTVTPQAMAITGFVGCDGRETSDRRALELASHILSSRLVKRIREELSIVYSIRAIDRPAWVYRDSGIFSAGAPCDPQNADKVIEEVDRIFKDFAENGPTEQELANAKKQILENLETEMREPSFWFDLLQNHDLQGHDFRETKDVKQAFQRYTAEQVRKTFAKYFTPQRQFRVTALPQKTPTSTDKPAEEPVTAPAS